jgi:hypothetical protein
MLIYKEYLIKKLIKRTLEVKTVKINTLAITFIFYLFQNVIED